MLPLYKTIGVIGGGQLAKLIALEGKRIGFHFKFWAEPDQSAISDLGPRLDESICSLQAFCESVDLLVLDYEHISLQEIEIIEKFSPYLGQAKLLRIGRDRLSEKKLQEALQLPMNDYLKFDSRNDINIARNKLGLPFVLKKRFGSYDGKGQIIIKNEEDLAKVINKEDLDQYIAEKFIPFEKELSLISVRNKEGDFQSYDLCENIHKDGILLQTKNIKNSVIKQQAHEINKAIADHCEYVGVFAVEYFYVNNQLMINEISPRVHNSGHWTLDASLCSQFENHLRACVGLTLGNTNSNVSTQMINIIGDFSDYQKLFQNPKAKIYIYNKSPRTNRKIGHVNLIVA